MEGTAATILDVLRGHSHGFLDDDALQLVCLDQSLSPDSGYYDLSQKERDLVLGRLYYSLYELSSGNATEKVSDGGFSHSESRQLSKSDIEKWRSLHRHLFSKWGIAPLCPSSSCVRLINF